MAMLTYEGATPEQLRHPLVHHFLEIHDMFRRQLDAMLEFVDHLLANQQQLRGAETTARVRTLAHATYQYTQMLHFHHHGESASMFPALRAEGLDESVVERLEADHDEIAMVIERIDRAMRSAAELDPQAVDGDLRRLAEVLRAHLAYEETHVCPLMTRWKRWPGY
jgi:hemerythrin-like domain-containing protein